MALGFVTGATGFIGRNLVFELSRRGWDVIALVRERGSEAAEALANLPHVTLAQGDIRIAHTLLKALPQGLDVVFHCAADTSTWSGHKARQNEINIEGTRNVIYTTYEAQAQVLVHVSTASVYGDQKHQPYDESTLKLGGKSVSNYVRSKLAAEQAIVRAVDRGLEAVIVNPGHVMGRFDMNNWATLIKMADRQTLPGIPTGSGCFAHAEAVCSAIISAAEVGKSGENYLLGGPHATFEELISLIAAELGKEPPSRVVPRWLLHALGRWNTAKSRVTQRPPNGMTREAAWFVSHDDHFSSQKAMTQLGYTPIDLKTIVRDAVAWQAQKGHVTASGQPPLSLKTSDQQESPVTAVKPTLFKPPTGQKVRAFSDKPA